MSFHRRQQLRGPRTRGYLPPPSPPFPSLSIGALGRNTIDPPPLPPSSDVRGPWMFDTCMFYVSLIFYDVLWMSYGFDVLCMNKSL